MITVKLPVNTEELENFQAVCADYEVTITKMLTIFVQKTAREGDIPFDITKEGLVIPLEELKALVGPSMQKYGIKKAYLFGDYANKTANYTSDIKICLEEDTLQGDSDLSRLEIELMQVLHKDVHLITTDSQNQALVQKVKKEGLMLYDS